MRDFPKAMTALRSMPRGSYEAAAKRPGFLNAAAAVYSAHGFCLEAEGLLTRSLDLDKAAGRRPAQGTQLQLASVWMREGRHDRASAGYRDVVAADSQSVDGWRGYITALHNAHQDFSALDEAQRMPAGVRTKLMSDFDFLRLLGSVHAEVGNNAQAVELLEQARARYQAAGQPLPPDLAIQLAWTMVAGSKYAHEAPALVAATKARTDLSKEQRDALDDIASTLIVRTAEEAMRAQDRARAIAVLTGASRELPGNARIRSVLASVYLQQREYDKALDLYRSSGMTGATAADYRAAAGIALQAQRNIVAEKFLWEGRQRWPDDPELLHMTALQALSHDDYEGTEHYLVAALAAARKAETNGGPRLSDTCRIESEAEVVPATDLSAPGVFGEMSCRPDSPRFRKAAPFPAFQPQRRRGPRATRAIGRRSAPAHSKRARNLQEPQPAEHRHRQPVHRSPRRSGHESPDRSRHRRERIGRDRQRRPGRRRRALARSRQRDSGWAIGLSIRIAAERRGIRRSAGERLGRRAAGVGQSIRRGGRHVAEGIPRSELDGWLARRIV